MLRLTKNEGLDFIEQDILYCWGCPSYPATLDRLRLLYHITVDPVIREHIEGLRTKLLFDAETESYEQLYYNNRLQLENGVQKKLKFAKDILEMETREAA